MPKDVDESTNLNEILNNKDLTLYGVIKRIKIFLYFHPYDKVAKEKLAELLSLTSYGQEQSAKLYKELNEEQESSNQYANTVR